MKNLDHEILSYIVGIALGIIFVFAIVIGTAKCTVDVDKKNWNDGYCNCGGHWEYLQAVGHQYTTTYIYECDRCGKHIELKNER